MGPDYSSQQQRIIGEGCFFFSFVFGFHPTLVNLSIGNFWRVAEFEVWKKFDIIFRCRDTGKICGRMIDGEAVGQLCLDGKGLVWDWHFIYLCEALFRLESLED